MPEWDMSSWFGSLGLCGAGRRSLRQRTQLLGAGAAHRECAAVVQLRQQTTVMVCLPCLRACSPRSARWGFRPPRRWRTN